MSVTVFHQTEHALIPLDAAQQKALTAWLAWRVGLPAGLEVRGGRLVDATGTPIDYPPRADDLD